MANDAQAVARELMEIAARGAAPQEINRAGRRALRAIAEMQRELRSAETLVQGILNLYGANDLHTATALAPEVTRGQRIAKLARLDAERHGGVARSATLAQQLILEGDKGSQENVAIAVGNVLNRLGWERIEPGVYKSPGDGSDGEGGTTEVSE